jgi:hypothetical protein
MLFLRKANSLRAALWSLFWYGTVKASTYRERAMECFTCEARIEKETRCGPINIEGRPEGGICQKPMAFSHSMSPKP